MSKHQFNSYSLSKMTQMTDDYPHQDSNRFVFVTDDKIPNTVWIYRYHNNKEFKYPCVLQDKDLCFQIDFGVPVTTETARTAWKILVKHGFTREMEHIHA